MQRTKRIIFVIWHVSGKGGTETVVKEVTRLLNRVNGFEPQVYVLGDSDDKQWLKGIKFGHSPFVKNKWLRVFPYFFWLYHYLRKEKPDLVVGLSPVICQLLAMTRWALQKKFPIISWMHFSLTANHMKQTLLKRADYHFAISTGIANQLHNLGIEKNRIYTIYNPVKKTDKMIKRPTNKSIFVYMGRITFEGQKRLKDMFDALAMVEGPWQLDIVGDGDDRSICQTYTEKIGIEKNVVWHGWQSDPWSVINEATALVLSSEFEGFPMVLVEAIARGVYCISSDCPTGPEDIIEEDVNGELYRTGDVQALRQIMQRMINNKKLPNQLIIKASINRYYMEHYQETFLYALNDILNK